jgi:hypothetical protein
MIETAKHLQEIERYLHYEYGAKTVKFGKDSQEAMNARADYALFLDELSHIESLMEDLVSEYADG